jgi:Mor family transcriptional regulator
METRKPRYNEKVDRNIEIYQDRLQGLSWTKLSFKYNLTIKTISSIVKRLQVLEEAQKTSLEFHNQNQNINSNQQ